MTFFISSTQTMGLLFLIHQRIINGEFIKPRMVKFLESNWSDRKFTAHLLAATSNKIFSVQFGGTDLWASTDGFSSNNTTNFGGAVLQDLQMFSGTAYFSGSNGLLGSECC